jgi:phosphoribosyl-ATP pyrophosphohydrolase/phosphoribosyl-AMP cyclohydrolase/histidinol dehydrogenase
MPLLRIVKPKDVPSGLRDPVDDETRNIARQIVDDVRTRGESALREHAEKLGDMEAGKPLIIEPDELERAKEKIAPPDLELLERTAGRIRTFAEAQVNSVAPVEIPVPGGMAGQNIAPVDRAGCYAPGGRFPLPSSVLMTAVTARAAGVKEVWVASPRPKPITLASAAIARVDGLLQVGGAQAIAALAFGAGPVPQCDTIVGPGNRFVTAAKQLVFGHVSIDMLAGPSELAVMVDDSADARIVAADLLAQAEHDPDAITVLVSLSERLIEEVELELKTQLPELSTKETAAAAMKNSLAVLVKDINEAIEVCDKLAPEHLELHVVNPAQVAPHCNHYGGLFIGAKAAEVLGDYGAGPNHTLPTGGTARHSGGLSVFDFLRIRTWLEIDDPQAAAQLVKDAKRLAELEGLTGHSNAAKVRLVD